MLKVKNCANAHILLYKDYANAQLKLILVKCLKWGKNLDIMIKENVYIGG